MRLRSDTSGEWTPRFTTKWEADFLAELPADCWVALHLPGVGEPIGAIHASTHKIRFYTTQELAQNQIVNLGQREVGEPKEMP